MAGWHHQLDAHEFGWTPGVGDGQGGLLAFWRSVIHGVTKSQTRLSDLIELSLMRFPGDSADKESACNAGDPGSIPGSGRSPGEGNGNPLQDYCLENPTDRGAW